ncbi:MAG: Gfo/Idh/MocA family oxidoreductase [Spirochaetaceae bacterium]|jgi:predicted dehydrogenase|nr:Gfo/Idh/MocA family oxidoreductase [Spirochaetaceae bacterium]
MEKLKAAIIGAGSISGVYINNLLTMFSRIVELSAIADGIPEKAQEAAEKYGLDFAESTGALLERGDISLIVNLTPPAAHFAVAKAALEAGKHIYNEKPLCTDLSDAQGLLETARKNNLRVGCAPDTFLGAGLQTARKLIADGWIGRPVAGTAFLMSRGPEHWHPAPEFFYAKGGGPLFDMGPYYITALVSLLGPVSAVSGSTAISFENRLITSEPKRGKTIAVETPTHVSALLDFQSGAMVSMIMSFDVWSHSLPYIEIYGSEGTMQVGDPNFFLSPVRIKRHRAEEWQTIPLFDSVDFIGSVEEQGEGHGSRMPLHNRYVRDNWPACEHWFANNNWRGIGVADMALAIGEKRPHRASGNLAIHVLEVMTRILESGETGKRLAITHQAGKSDGGQP